MAKQSEVLALLDPGYFEVTPKILVGHPEPTSLGHGEGVRLDLRRAVHIGDPSPGPNRPSLLALKNVHKLVDDVQIDVHAGAVREMRAADHDHVVPGLDHSETPCANLGGVRGGATYIHPGPSNTWAHVPFATFRVASSSPGYFRNGVVSSRPTKTLRSGYRPGGVSRTGRNSRGTGYLSRPFPAAISGNAT